jgi:hypothetical protein
MGLGKQRESVMVTSTEESLKTGLSSEKTSTQASPQPRALGFGYSTYKSKGTPSLLEGSEDYLRCIEASLNFSKAYSLTHSPREDIFEGTIESVIFKVSESQLQQTATYHFWKKLYANPVFYVITVSTKDRQIDAVEYKGVDSLSVKFFKITEQNTVDIVEYSAPGM